MGFAQAAEEAVIAATGVATAIYLINDEGGVLVLKR